MTTKTTDHCEPEVSSWHHDTTKTQTLIRPRVSSDDTFVHIILPAYNEAPALRLLLRAIRQTMEQGQVAYHVVVVDDGSEDGTAHEVALAADEMPVSLIRHLTNCGLGAALESGIGSVLARCGPNDFVVTMDADNTHPPELILEMLVSMQEGHNLVIGSMFVPGARLVGVPPYRQALSLAGRWAFQMMFPISGVRCYTSGYRMIRAELLLAAKEYYAGRLVTERGFTSTADLLLKLRYLPLRAKELPLVLRYDRKPGRSKMAVMRNIWETLHLIARRRLLGCH